MSEEMNWVALQAEHVLRTYREGRYTDEEFIDRLERCCNHGAHLLEAYDATTRMVRGAGSVRGGVRRLVEERTMATIHTVQTEITVPIAARDDISTEMTALPIEVVFSYKP